MMRRCVGIGLLFAFAGFLIGLRSVAYATLPHILVPGDSMNFQEVLDGLPLPHLLDWNPTLMDALIGLRQTSGMTLLLARLLLYGALLWAALSVLNPSFRLLRIARAPAALPETEEQKEEEVKGRRGEGEEQRTAESPITQLPNYPTTQLPNTHPPGATHILLETATLRKMGTLLLTFGIPLALFWMVVSRLGGALDESEHPLLGMRLEGTASRLSALWLMALGGALWAGFRPDGLAGEFPSKTWGSPGRALPGLLLRGALFGLVLYALLRWGIPGTLTGLLQRYQALGTFNRAYWNEIAGRYLFSVAAVWFAAGSCLVLLGRPGARTSRRGVGLLLPLCAAAAAVFAQRPFTPAALAARLDFTRDVALTIPLDWNPRFPASGVPDGPAAARALARRANLNLPTDIPSLQTERSILVFRPDGVFTARQSLLTEDGLSADPVIGQQVLDFLKRRDYRTALSWTAIKHLFNVGTNRFNLHDALAACLLDLTHCPHLRQCNRTVRASFFICAASPQNLSLLDQYADESRFVYPDRESKRLMGDFYIHFGEVEKALVWYRRAEMPQTFMTRIRQEKPLFHQGRVSGVVRLNGRPLAGVQVGVLPKRLNSLPRDLEPFVLRAEQEILAPPPPYFVRNAPPPGHPRPWAFRWISAGATTDAQGAFALDYLTEGTYYLVLSLPPDIHLTPFQDAAMQVRNAPQPLTLNYAAPQTDLGTIDLTYRR